MGKARIFVQKMQELQNRQIPAKCNFCGASGASLLVEEQGDRWTDWRPAYKTEYRRFLCPFCAKTKKPSLCHLLEKGDKSALRALPLHSEFGSLLPEVTRKQLEAHFLHIPMYALGQMKILAIWEDVTYCSDCLVLKLVPDKDQDWHIDFCVEKHGYIYTSVPLSRKLPNMDLPCRIRLHSYFDEFDKPRTAILHGY